MQTLLRLAWKDSRGSRRRLGLYLASVSIGVAALVSLQAFWTDVTRAIDHQARGLLGADFVIRAQGEFPVAIDQALQELDGELATEDRFFNMARFPRTGGTRLVAVRGLSGAFPFYGELETQPAEAASQFRSGAPTAVLDAALMHQLELQIGDEMMLGEQSFTVIGQLKKVPGETVVMSQFAPRVFINGAYVQATNLLRFGSRVYRRRFLKLNVPVPARTLRELGERWQTDYNVVWDTVETRREKIGRRLERLYQFLNLVAFAALLLAGIGIGTAIRVHVRAKQAEIAVLRCLGASVGQTTSIFLFQCIGLGVLGGLLGAVLGTAVQIGFPALFGDLLPVALETRPSPIAIATGIGVGMGGTVLFALPPLLCVRLIPPLAALRPESVAMRPDPLAWPVYGLLLLALLGAGIATAPTWYQGVGLCAGLLVAAGMLALVAKCMLWVLRRLTPTYWPFAVRQGLLNLHRPGNQTVVLVLAIGLGAFLLGTLHLCQQQILGQLHQTDDRNGPNLVLFDIQPAQLAPLRALAQELGVEVRDEVAMVAMRLEAVKGESVREIRDNERKKPRGKRIQDWKLRRQYRSTYRSTLADSEKLVAGKMAPPASLNDEVIPVTIEQSLAEDLRLTLGDEVTFNVQGLLLDTRICGIRDVDWYRVQPNFYFVFPEGVLEGAPQMNVLALRAGSDALSGQMQRLAVEKFSNVSAVDLGLIVDSLSSILDSITFAVRFMALFSILTGLLVLSASLWSTREQRLQESVLLKSVGASRKQVLSVMATEYLSLGLLAGGSGVGLAVLASLLLGVFVFETPLHWQVFTPLAGVVLIALLTVAIGAMQSIGVYRRSALSVLRE